MGVPIDPSIALGVRRNALEIVQRYQQPLDDCPLKGGFFKFRQCLDIGVDQASTHAQLLTRAVGSSGGARR
jgi:hypothetical protein